MEKTEAGRDCDHVHVQDVLEILYMSATRETNGIDLKNAHVYSQ